MLGNRRISTLASGAAVLALIAGLALLAMSAKPGESSPQSSPESAAPPAIPWRPLVTFCFDDTHDTAYTLAYPLLERYGLKAGAVAITDLVGMKTRLSWPQIEDLARAGWDIMDGTASHPDTTQISQAQLDEELRKSKNIIEDHVGSGNVGGLVWPYTNAGDEQAAVARRYFDWAAGGGNPLKSNFLLRHGLPASKPEWPYKIRATVIMSKDAKDGDITPLVQGAVDGPTALFIVFERVLPSGADGLAVNLGDVQKVIEYLLANDAVIVKPSEFYRILRYDKPDYYRTGFELVRNRQLTTESEWSGIPSFFKVVDGNPIWNRSGGPNGQGYLQISGESAFRTLELPVLAGGSYRFSFMHRSGVSTTRNAEATVQLYDISDRPVRQLDSIVPTRSDAWGESTVDFVAPQGADYAYLAVKSWDEGTLLTTGWSLVRR